MAISYNDVPLATQQIDQSQAPIRTNFNSISALIDIDHETFVDTKHGYHKALHIVDGVPAPALVAGEGSIYVDTNNVFLKNGTGTAVSLTSTTGNAAIGFYILPNGLIVKWGYIVGTGARDAIQTYTYPVGATIPVFSAIYTVSVASTNRINNVVQTGTARLTIVTLQDTSTTQILVQQVGTFGSTGVAHDWTYVAIGS